MEKGAEMFRKILYPTDFSDVAHKALEYIKQLKQAGTEEVLIVHVLDERQLIYPGHYFEADSVHDEEPIMTHEPSKIMDSSQWWKKLEEDATQQIGEIESLLKEIGFRVETRVLKGTPLREILRIEKVEDVSMIVIGSHGRSNIEEMLLGSVSEKVIRKCEKPVLVIKR
jgi:nucleotide-binding universal stress UspA family protein